MGVDGGRCRLKPAKRMLNYANAGLNSRPRRASRPRPVRHTSRRPIPESPNRFSNEDKERRA